MRTTLTLDDDVAKLLLSVRQSRRAGLKVVINEALRHGLLRMVSPPGGAGASKQKAPIWATAWLGTLTT